jgi:hypothetical protein
VPSAESKPLASAIPSLTRDEMESYLADIVNGKVGTVAFLKKELAQKLERGKPAAPAPLRTLDASFDCGIKFAGRDRFRHGAKWNGKESKGWNNSTKRRSRLGIRSNLFVSKSAATPKRRRPKCSVTYMIWVNIRISRRSSNNALP